MKNLLILLLIFLINCGNRNVQKNKERISESEKVEASAETKVETASTTTERTLFDLFENNTKLSIKPIGDFPAKFILIHNGQKIEGETSGELNFSNDQTTVRQETEVTKVTKTTYVTHTTYKSKIFFKSVLADTLTKSDRPMFWFLAVACIISILLWEAIKSRLKFPKL